MLRQVNLFQLIIIGDTEIEVNEEFGVKIESEKQNDNNGEDFVQNIEHAD